MSRLVPDLDEAIAWLTRAADSGDREASRRVADQLERTGDLDGAITSAGIRPEELAASRK